MAMYELKQFGLGTEIATIQTNPALNSFLIGQ